MIDIKNISDFDALLDKTIAELDGLVISEPDYPVWQALQQQLHAMKLWSTDDAKPSQKQLSSINIGLIAARELEPASQEWMQDLIDRLSQLNQYWRHWPTGKPIVQKPLPKGLRKAAVVTLVLTAVVLAAAMLLSFIARTKQGAWTPTGRSMLAGGVLTTLETSLNPYMVSLHHNPTNDRYSVRLKIANTTVVLAKEMQASELHFDAQLLGDDGRQLWFYVQELGAWDYKARKRVTIQDLQRANPGLGKFSFPDNSGNPLIAKEARNIRNAPADLWSGERRLYGFDKTLKVTTPDFSQKFLVNPTTLRADKLAK
jgi:hypothetical protein